MYTEGKEEQIIKAIRQASASIWLDKLPLSEEYVLEYTKNRLDNDSSKEINGPVLKKVKKNVE